MSATKIQCLTGRLWEPLKLEQSPSRSAIKSEHSFCQAKLVEFIFSNNQVWIITTVRTFFTELKRGKGCHITHRERLAIIFAMFHYFKLGWNHTCIGKQFYNLRIFPSFSQCTLSSFACYTERNYFHNLVQEVWKKTLLISLPWPIQQIQSHSISAVTRWESLFACLTSLIQLLLNCNKGNLSHPFQAVSPNAACSSWPLFIFSYVSCAISVMHSFEMETQASTSKLILFWGKNWGGERHPKCI